MTSILYKKKTTRFEPTEINIREADNKQLLTISNELGLALNLQEMQAIKQYFLGLKRNPTDIELQTIGQTWSEHCFHKTFKGNIISTKGKLLSKSLFKEYIAKATKELNPKWCISAFEDNAGIIDFDKDYAIAVKVETHNHPSAIEPFGGAATGTGGVIRDILGVWADPIACTDVLCFGPLNYDYKKLPEGTKHPKYVYRGVVAGIGAYGNNMGIPTVNGAIYFDDSYVGNVVVYCGCIGILPKKAYIKNTKPGDIAVLAGGRTGRDGIHGVTFASLELTKESEKISRPAVQIANPIEEEKLKRAIIAIRDQKLASGITDLGGGGLSSATGETAHKSNCGIQIQLDKVPLKYPDLVPWEIYISESQERMLLTVPEKNLKKVLEVFENEEVEATPIGKFTITKTLRIDYQKCTVAELNLDFLFNPPKTRRVAEPKKLRHVEPSFVEPTDSTQDLQNVLSSPNVASKESVIRTYDHEVKGNTALKPLQSKDRGPNDAAIIKPLNNSWKGIVISCGMNPNYGKIDPYWMAASAVDEAIRNNVAVGGTRVALLDNFTWGSPEKPDRLGSLLRACEACYDFARAFGTPFISGKDSLYNESPLGPVTPTLLITAVGIISDIRKAISVDLKQTGNPLYLIGQTYAELGGSEYYRLKGFIGKNVPKVRAVKARRIMDAVSRAIHSGYVKSCHDLSEGGLAVAAAEMAFSGGYGIELDLRKVPVGDIMARNDFILFSESNSRFLVEVKENHREDLEALMRDNVCSVVGRVNKSNRLVVRGLNGKSVVDASLNELLGAWKKTLGD
jgi:phosphoribosylformylglycinamidine synthase